jgi:hypothetical protein
MQQNLMRNQVSDCDWWRELLVPEGTAYFMLSDSGAIVIMIRIVIFRQL